MSPPPYQLDGPPGRRSCPAGEHTARLPQVFGYGGFGRRPSHGATGRGDRGVESDEVGPLKRGRLDAVTAGLLFMAGMRRSEVSGCPHEAAPHRQPVVNLGNEPGWPPVAPLAGSGRLAASAESGTRRREDDPPGAATALQRYSAS